MIVLITGKPGVGKSTVIDACIATLQPSDWVVTRSIPREDGWRAGFEAFRSDGTRRVISHKTDIDSPVIIGKNHVDLDAVEEMFASVLSTTSGHKLTIVDEIGPIQLLSSAFVESLEHVFVAQPKLLATIHYSDESLARYREDPGALCFTVTPDNRGAMPDLIKKLFDHYDELQSLTPVQRQTVRKIIQSYTDNSQQLQIDKFFNNAVSYITQGAVRTLSPQHYSVRGRHNKHDVSLTAEGLVCDCDLYNGVGKYTNHAGECSHIMAVKVVTEQ